MKFLIKLVTSTGARDTYILTLGNVADSVFAFLFTVITFRLLTSSDFGLFSGFNNLIFSASMILDAGISQALLYFLPLQKSLQQKTLIGTAIALRLLIACSFALVLSALAGSVSQKFFPGSTPNFVYITSLAIILASFIDVLIFSLQGLRRFLASVLVSNTYSLSRLLSVGVISFWSFSYYAQDALLITVYGPVIGIALALFWLKPSLPDKQIARKLLGFGGFMGLYRVCQIIALRSDVQIILASLGASSAGIYSVAARLGNFYPLIIVTLNSLFSSRLRLQKSLSADFVKKSSFLLFAILFSMTLCSWQAPLIVRLLFGAKAEAAGLIYRYLTLAYLPLMAATLPISILVFFHSQTKVVGYLGVLQVVLMLSSSLLLTPKFQEIGPIIGLGLANSVLLILSTIKVLTYNKISNNLTK